MLEKHLDYYFPLICDLILTNSLPLRSILQSVFIRFGQVRPLDISIPDFSLDTSQVYLTSNTNNNSQPSPRLNYKVFSLSCEPNGKISVGGVKEESSDIDFTEQAPLDLVSHTHT